MFKRSSLYLIVTIQYWYCTGQYVLVKNIPFQIMLAISMEANHTYSLKKNQKKPHTLKMFEYNPFKNKTTELSE